MYFAEGNRVFYYHYSLEDAELFLTVHPTTSNKSVEEQAEVLARILNKEIP